MFSRVDSCLLDVRDLSMSRLIKKESKVKYLAFTKEILFSFQVSVCRFPSILKYRSDMIRKYVRE